MAFPSKARCTTYRPKTEQSAGVGILGIKQRTETNLSLLKESEVFQSESVAIHYCVREIQSCCEKRA